MFTFSISVVLKVSVRVFLYVCTCIDDIDIFKYVRLWLNHVYIIIVCVQLFTIMSLVGENSKIKMIIKLITTTTQSCRMYVCMCHHHACIYHSIHSKININYLLPTCALHIKILYILIHHLENKFHATHKVTSLYIWNKFWAVVMLVPYWVSNQVQLVASWN